MRKCSKCGRRLPKKEFYKCKERKDGLRADCKTCNKGYQAEMRKTKEERELHSWKKRMWVEWA